MIWFCCLKHYWIICIKQQLGSNFKYKQKQHCVFYKKGGIYHLVQSGFKAAVSVVDLYKYLGIYFSVVKLLYAQVQSSAIHSPFFAARMD